MNKDVQEKLKLLANTSLGFTQKLRIAASLDLDFWENRTNPPNMSVHAFKVLLPQIPIGVKVDYDHRKSFSGPHGQTGEDMVFMFEFSIIKLGRRLTYFVKGYFFDKGNCRGVCIQSFREIGNTTLKIVR